MSQVVKEIGSGVNDSRPKFLKLLIDPTVIVIVVEHKDRATRFGFRYLETLARTARATHGSRQSRRKWARGFGGRSGGHRLLVLRASVRAARAKRKTETIVKEFTGQESLSEERRWSMQLVEQHRIDRHDSRFAAIDAAAFASKNLYNAALYLTRQAFIHEAARHDL